MFWFVRRRRALTFARRGQPSPTNHRGCHCLRFVRLWGVALVALLPPLEAAEAREGGKAKQGKQRSDLGSAGGLVEKLQQQGRAFWQVTAFHQPRCWPPALT